MEGIYKMNTEITLVFEYRQGTYNESSIAVPRIGESILVEDIKTTLVVTDVIYDFTKKGVVYLMVKKKKE